MTTEQLPREDQYTSLFDYTRTFLTDELTARQNSGEDGEIHLDGLYQKLSAESLIHQLRRKKKLRKFGGKSLEFVMIETDEPYMYNIMLRTTEPSEARPLYPEKMPIPVLPLETPPSPHPYT